MNHCQPGRILEPNLPNYPTLSGFVISAPLADSTHYRHYVFSDWHSPLYKMPTHLFRLNNYRGMKNTQILRYEKSLEFGDNIYFTVDTRTNEVIDYEMGLKVHETECKEGLNLVKTIALLPPEDKGKFCWTELFGNIELNDNMFERLHLEAKHDVPVHAWISVEIEKTDRNEGLKCAFYEFIEVAVDDRKIAWETDWNTNHANRPTNYYKLDTTDEDEEEEKVNNLIEKKEDQILDVRLKLEGYLIDMRELFCPQLKDYCVEIGLWSKTDAKVDNNYDLLGNKYCFDAYYSDVLQIYIAYYYENITDYWIEDNVKVYDKECSVIYEDYGTKLLQIEICPSDNYGIFYNTQSKFGLVADPFHVLGPFPILFAELEMDSLWVNVVDTGPGKKLSRFTIAELERQPEETIEVIEQAKQLALEEIENIDCQNEDKRKHTICSEGFIIDANHTFFSPRYANQEIVLPVKYWKEAMIGIGQWIKFEALYNGELNNYEIFAGMPSAQLPVPYSKIVEIVDGKNMIRYLFKIEAEMINNPQNDPSKIFLSGLLYNPQFGGLIADPEGKFKKINRAKKHKLIVESQPEGSTRFKLVRMVTANEQMDSERYGFIPNNIADDEDDENCYDERDIGIELEGQVDLDDEGPIMQTDFLSEASIRERQMRARDRRRQRDKEDKLLQERLKQLNLEAEICEEELDPTPSTSAAAV